MKIVIGLIFAIALVACVAQASDVVVLTKDNFDEVVKDNAFVLVEFFAPWCGHCKKLAPEYENAATALKGSAVLATVDCTVEEELASRFSIQGFPTLKFFKRGGEPIEFQAERNAKGIENWVRSKMEPAVVPLETKADFDKFNERATIARVVAFAGDDDQELLKVVTEVAESPASGEFSFGRISNAELASELGQKMGSVVFFYAHQNPVVYGDSMTTADLQSYLKEKAYPRLETLVLNQAFINRVTQAQKTMVMCFHENPEQLEFFRKLADELHGEAHISETQVAAYPELAAQWGASGTKYPTFVVAVWEDDHPVFKAWDEELELTLESAKDFIHQCVAGTCTPYKKSQPLPEEPTEEGSDVRTLVYKNFDSIVLDSSKDVLVEFYAPWCGHCKALAPLYEELATVFKPIESVVIAKIDATANYVDASYNIKGFPTLLYFRANDKANPLRYEDKRDFPTISRFVIDNASVQFDSSIIVPAVDPEIVEAETDSKEEL